MLSLNFRVIFKINYMYILPLSAHAVELIFPPESQVILPMAASLYCNMEYWFFYVIIRITMEKCIDTAKFLESDIRRYNL